LALAAEIASLKLEHRAPRSEIERMWKQVAYWAAEP
jgi:hypothetical protein